MCIEIFRAAYHLRGKLNTLFFHKLQLVLVCSVNSLNFSHHAIITSAPTGETGRATFPIATRAYAPSATVRVPREAISQIVPQYIHDLCENYFIF